MMFPKSVLLPVACPPVAFQEGGYHGFAAASAFPVPFGEALAALADVRSAESTLHWGRNHLYIVRLGTGEDAPRFVVKEFRHATWRRRFQRHRGGDKALLSWTAARAALEAGIATPEPVLAALNDAPDGPSYFVTRYAGGRVEARLLLREVQSGELRQFTAAQARGFVRAAARLARRMHDAGIRHRDFSMGNLLLRFDGGDEPDIVLVDLNRARVGKPPGTLNRLRDLCRLEIADATLRRQFIDEYHGGPPSALRRGLYEALSRSFMAKNPLKRKVRAPFEALLRPFRPAKPPPPHLGPPADAKPLREAVVWDPLTEQPFHHAGKARRNMERLKDLPAFGGEAWAVLKALPRTIAAHRAGSSAGPPGRLGIGLAHGTAPEPALMGFLEGMGTRRVLLRLNAWEPLEGPEALARELHTKGFELGFAVAQNRDLVRDPARWDAAIEAIAARFLPLGNTVQLGQAINRSKWGFWTRQEYLDLAGRAAAILRKRDGAVRLLGPAVIDFEPHVLSGALNLPAPGLAFDAVSCLLYVDRRGAPENTQFGLDLQGKVRWFDAVARASKNAPGRRLWITETNWPLRAGPHSPAGRGVAVDEEAQADYLARYALLALSTGVVERVYWWQLAARGYGLLDVLPDGTLKARPSYHAFRTLARVLEATGRVTEVPAPAGARIMRLDGRPGTVLAAWSPRGRVSLPRPEGMTGAWGRDGEALMMDRALELGGAVRYFTGEGGAALFDAGGANA